MSKKKPKPFERKTNYKPPRKTFLIVCEGIETEPNYFAAFQKIGRDNKTATIQIIPASAVGKTVVKKAKKLKDDGAYGEDEVWCVFDRDAKKENNNQQNFNDAIRLAIENKVNLAISNDAFELWYLLHYEYYVSETHRSDIKEMLSSKTRLGEKYEKNCDDMYEKLKDKQANAIKYAKNLLFSYGIDPDNLDNLTLEERTRIHNQNPSTTVYRLVEKLNEVIFAPQQE